MKKIRFLPKTFGLKPLALTLVLGLTFAVYIPSLGHDFVGWDDGTHLIENPLVRSLAPANIAEIFARPLQGTYIPLSILSFAVEYQLFKYTPWVYHFDNILLHLAVTALVFFLALALLKRSSLSPTAQIQAATLAGIIFGIHPMHVESVSWVTERKDVLYAFFYMLSLWTYERHLSRDYHPVEGEKPDRRLYLLSVMFGLFSILAKPMALSLPLAVILIDWVLGRKFSWKLFLEKLPFFLIIIPITWLTYSVHARVPVTHPGEAVLIWGWCLTFYLKTFFIPFQLSPLYEPVLPLTWNNPIYLRAMALTVLAVLVFIRFRNNRWLIFGLLYFFLSTFFLMRFDFQDVNVVADRFMYLPSFGFCLFLGYAWAAWQERHPAARRWAGCLLAGMILFMGYRTMGQQTVWADTLSLWNYVLQRSPREALAYTNRGMYYESQRDYARALADQNTALALNPSYADALNNRGVIYLRLNKNDLALQNIDQALKLEPSSAKIYNNRGLVYTQKGELEAAIKDFTQALKLDRYHEAAYNNRGIVLEKQGHIPEALADYEAALAINPDYAEAFNNRGNIHRRKNNYPQALADYSRAIALAPDNAKAFNNRGVAYAETEQFTKALADYNQALALDPGYTKVYNNRAIALEQLGRPEEALEDYSEAMKQDPLYFEAYRNRGIFYYRKKEWSKALEDFNKALELNPQSGPVFFSRSLNYLEMGDTSSALADAYIAESLGEDVREYLQHLREITQLPQEAKSGL